MACLSAADSRPLTCACQAWACKDAAAGGECHELDVMHAAPNLMAVSLADALGQAPSGAGEGGAGGADTGDKARQVRAVIRFRFRTPRDQYALMVLGLGLVAYLAARCGAACFRPGGVRRAGAGAGGREGRGGVVARESSQKTRRD